MDLLSFASAKANNDNGNDDGFGDFGAAPSQPKPIQTADDDGNFWDFDTAPTPEQANNEDNPAVRMKCWKSNTTLSNLPPVSGHILDPGSMVGGVFPFGYSALNLWITLDVWGDSTIYESSLYHDRDSI